MDGTSSPTLLEDRPRAAASDAPRHFGSVVPDTVPADLLGQRPAAAPRDSLITVAGRYAEYVALFVGAGLISGAVVHFPLAPARYAVIGGFGAVLFAAASVLADRQSRDPTALVRLAVTSLVLALGIGMISGSIQHFQDIPERAAQLIPIGLAISVAAFVLRNELRPAKDDLAALALWTVVGVVALGVLLGTLADHVIAKSEAAKVETAAGENKRTQADKGRSTGEGEDEAETAADGHGH